jgi:hypothetical protein
MPSISPHISQRSRRGLSWGHLNQVVCLFAFRLWPARRCAQGADPRLRPLDWNGDRVDNHIRVGIVDKCPMTMGAVTNAS